jgi:hypothetical protein
MDKLLLPVSAFSSINKVCRLRSVIYARQEGLIKYYKEVLGSAYGFKAGLEDEICSLGLLLDRLDNNSTIYNASYSVVRSEWLKFPRTLELHCIQLFGSFKKKKFDYGVALRNAESQLNHWKSVNNLEKVDYWSKAVEREKFTLEFVEKFFSNMAEMSKLGRKAELMNRLMLEVGQRYEEGWYFVFNTLTVDPWMYSKVFVEKGCEGKNYWNEYIRSIDRWFGKAAQGSYRKAQVELRKGNDYHNYFAVVEKGAKSGRLHIHVLHAFKALPVECVDPNLGAVVPNRREITAFKSFWNCGHSSPIAVRFGALDAYSKRGWLWPVVISEASKVYEPVEYKGFKVIVNYVSKYMTKSMEDKEVGCIWRTRVSRRLGKSTIKMVLSEMSLKSKLLILREKKMKLKHNNVMIPRILLRRMILLGLPSTLFQELYRKALRLRPVSLLKLVRDMIRNPQKCSLLNFGNIQTSVTEVMDAYRSFRDGTFSVGIRGVSYV